MNRLFAIYKCAKLKTHFQKIRFGIHRSDYMLQNSDDGVALKQVELNTIASGAAALATRTSELHKYIHKLIDLPIHGSLVTNKALNGLAFAISKGMLLLYASNASVRAIRS